MANITINVDSINQEYAEQAYHRSLRPTPYGTVNSEIAAGSGAQIKGISDDAVIHEKNDGLAEAERITYTLVEELLGDGTGEGQLRGNESGLPNSATDIVPVWSRNATNVKKGENRISAVNLYPEQRRTLQNWNDKSHIKRATLALGSVTNREAAHNRNQGVGRAVGFFPVTYNHADGTSTTITPTTAELNAFVTNNANRLMFGPDDALVADDWAASLATIAAGETMSVEFAENALYKAADEDYFAGSYRIPPLMEPEHGREMYMIFHSTKAFQNLKRDAEAKDLYSQDVSYRGLENNPYIRGGDIVIGQAIHRRVVEIDKMMIPTLAGAGNASADLEVSFICGRMAMCLGYGAGTLFTTDNMDDYGFENPLGIESCYAYEKQFYGGEQFAVMPVFSAAASA